MKVLGITTSPRRGGNSDILLGEALKAAEAAGAEVSILSLNDYRVGPCIECNACYKTGECYLPDDLPKVLEQILNADRIVFAAPVFFMGVCAQAKCLIDRAQCLWARKYVLNEPLFNEERDRRGLVIAVGGSKSKKMFESVQLTMKYYFDAIEVRYAANLFVNNTDDKGDILDNREAMHEAVRLGRELIVGPAPGKKPTVSLILPE